MAEKDDEDKYADNDDLFLPVNPGKSSMMPAALATSLLFGDGGKLERTGLWALNKTSSVVKNIYRETVSQAAEDAGKFAERAPFGLEIPASLIGLKKGAVKGVYQGLKKGILKKVRW